MKPAQTAAVRIAVDLHLFHHLGDGPEGKDISELALKTGADAELLSTSLGAILFRRGKVH